MDWRKLQSEPELVDNSGDVGETSEALGRKDGATPLSAAPFLVVPSAARKPSERFMRRSLQAKSKASTSERYRIATLKEKMNELVIETTNEATVFNGYRPGREAMPG